MVPQEFVRIFIDIYNTSAAFVIILFIGQIILMMRRIDRDLLKARLFLNEEVMRRTWMYISAAGASFALNTLIRFAISFTTSGSVLVSYYLVEVTQFIFLISFILAVYNWYVFINSFPSKGSINMLIEKSG